MIKIRNLDVWGFEHAIRGMRNPMNSWDKSDSYYDDGLENCYRADYVVGNNDLELMRKLYAAGHPHRKYLRQIFISMDITAPLYWWKEFDTYKVGTVANSCSTMHKIHSKQFTIDDFSQGHLQAFELSLLLRIIDVLNENRKRYIESGDKKYWWNMIQLLPISYHQRRTITMTYENAFNIYQYRKDHKLDEWVELCKFMKENLPYFAEISDLNNEGVNDHGTE